MPFLHKHIPKKRAANQVSHTGFISKKSKTINGWYDGNILNGKRHNFGTLRKPTENDTFHRTYIGDWKENKRHGEGWCYFRNGNIYLGFWQENHRNGIGIMWYNENNENNYFMYMGEWKLNKFHGSGVLWENNFNRYEGYFSDGKKHGEGTFYHCKTGQIQKGMWQNNICVTSILLDGNQRNYCLEPSRFPIPQVYQIILKKIE